MSGLAGEPGGRLLIDNVAVFDGESDELRDGPVLVEDGVVVAVGEDAEQGDGDRVLDGRGGTLLPGLIDAHFHAYGISLSMVEIETCRTSYVALAAVPRLSAALRRGFTTVRDVAGGDAGLAAALSQDLVPAPRYLFTGPALSQTGGHGDARPGEWDCCALGGHMCEVADGVDEVRRAVRDRFRQGAHAIKIMASGGVVSPSDPIRVPQYSAAEISAACEEASRRGSYVAAHAYSPEAIGHAVRNGVRSIEHGNLMDEQTARTMVEADAFLVPTLAAYDAMARHGRSIGMSEVARAKNAEVLDAGQRALEIAREAGVQIGFGTDLMGSLESEQLSGLALQAEALGVLETMRSATSRNARLLGLPDRGVVRPGAAADLLLLDANPLDRASVLWSAESRRAVVLAGQVVHEA